MKSKKPKRKRLMNDEDHEQLLIAFGSRLAACRQNRKISQAQLSVRSGIEVGNLGKYESGRREAGIAIVMILAKGLQIEPSELFNFPFEFESRVVPSR